jgi:hypothetical protein
VEKPTTDARHGKIKISAQHGLTSIQVIMSYVSRLLPQYRDHCPLNHAVNECELAGARGCRFPHTLPSSANQRRV